MNPETIIAAVNAAIALLNYITKARADLTQNAEFTDAQRADLDAKIAMISQLPYWQVID